MSSVTKILVSFLGLPGADHSGTGHKLAHNFTTLANIPLVAWLIYSIFSLRAATYEDFTLWLSNTPNVILSIAFVIVTLRHFTLELEVVFEDYIADIRLRGFVIAAMKIFWFALGLATIASILKVGL